MRFQGFEDENIEALKNRINHLVGNFIGTSNLIDYFSEFNKDVEELNVALRVPASQHEYNQKIFELQEEYIKSCQIGKQRRQEANQSISVDVKIVRNLAQINHEIKIARENLESYLSRTNRINYFLPLNNEKIDWWGKIESYAKKLDEKDNRVRLPRLKKLKEDWIAQFQFAHFNSKDLDYILEELDHFKWFLDLISDAVPKLIEGDRKIHAFIDKNREVLVEANAAIIVAIGWRLKAADLRGNLFFDDNWWALKHQFGEIFSEEDKQHYQELNYYIEMPQAVLSRKLNYDILVNFVERLKCARYSADRNKWFKSQWVLNPFGKFRIEPLLTPDLEVIPKLLQPYIPQNRPYFFGDNFVRYFYFRGKVALSAMQDWFYKNFLNVQPVLVPILNECLHQVNLFADRVNKDKKVDLIRVSHAPGFKSALYFKEIIQKEYERLESIRSASWWQKAFYWLPYFNSRENIEFHKRWLNTLQECQINVYENCEDIAKQITKDLRENLNSSIKMDVYRLPKESIVELQNFVLSFGLLNTQQVFLKLISPVNLFKKFNFFEMQSDDKNQLNARYRTINNDAVESFLRYANKYWESEQIEAAMKIASIIKGELRLKNKNDEEVLLKSIASWFDGDGQFQQSQELLSYVGKNIIVKLGDRGNDNALKFLNIFFPEGLVIWSQEKTRDLTEKFSAIHTALTKDINEEIVLSLETYDFKTYISDLCDFKVNYSYMEAISKALSGYIAQYDGSNSRYALLVYHLAKQNACFFPYLLEYTKKRFEYLLRNKSMEDPLVRCEDEELFKSLKMLEQSSIVEDVLIDDLDEKDKDDPGPKSRYSIMIETLSKILDKYDKGDDFLLEGLLLDLGSESIVSIYYAKRLKNSVDRYIKEENPSAFELLDPLYVDNNCEKQLNYLQCIAKIPQFQDQISEFLKEKINSLQSKEKISLLEQPRFAQLIRDIGDQSVKEHYRLARVHSLVKLNSKRSIDAFFSEFSFNEKTDDLNSMFTMDFSQQRLAKIFGEAIQLMIRDINWEGNIQYIIENLQYPSTKKCLYSVRIAWFNEFLFGKNYFEGIMGGDYSRQSQDLNMHLNNIQIPNDEVSLKYFYSENGLLSIRKYIEKFLNEFSEVVNESKLRTIDRYLKDDFFREDVKSSMYYMQLSVFSLAFEIMQKLKTKGSSVNYQDVAELLLKFYGHLDARRALFEHDKSLLAEVKFYESVIKSVENMIFTEYKQLTVDLEAMSRLTVKNRDNVSMLKREKMMRDLVRPLLLRRAISEDLSESFLEVEQNTELLIETAEKFVNHLVSSRISNLPLTKEVALLFSLGLSAKNKVFIENRFKLLFGNLEKKSTFQEVINAFVRVLNEHSLPKVEGMKTSSFRRQKTLIFKTTKSSELEDNLAILDNYNQNREKLTVHLNNSFPALLSCLRKNEPLIRHPLFDKNDVSFGESFIEQLSKREYQDLEVAFLLRIKNFASYSSSEDIENQQSDWIDHAELYQWMLTKRDPDSNFQTTVEEYAAAALKQAQTAFNTLEMNFDTLLDSRPSFIHVANKNLFDRFFSSVTSQRNEPLNEDVFKNSFEQQQQLLRDAIFVRSFGNNQQKKMLNSILERIIARQSQAMMQGNINNIVKEAVNFANSVIKLVGSDAQRMANAKMAMAWRTYKRDESLRNLENLREIAIKGSIPTYIDNLREGFYQYFVERFSLTSQTKQRFYENITKIEQTLLVKEMPLNPEEKVLKVFRELLDAICHNNYLPWKKPAEKHIYRLYYAVCLSVYAQQKTNDWQQQMLDRTAITNIQEINLSLQRLLNSFQKASSFMSENFIDKMQSAIQGNESFFSAWDVTEHKPARRLQVV